MRSGIQIYCFNLNTVKFKATYLFLGCLPFLYKVYKDFRASGPYQLSHFLRHLVNKHYCYPELCQPRSMTWMWMAWLCFKESNTFQVITLIVEHNFTTFKEHLTLLGVLKICLLILAHWTLHTNHLRMLLASSN